MTAANRLKQLVRHIKQCQCPIQAKNLHAIVVKSGAHLHGPLYSNTLIHLYAKARLLNDALQLFDEMPHRDLASWASLFTAYNHLHMPAHALLLFFRMIGAGDISPDHFIFATVVRACAMLPAVDVGRQLHAQFAVSPYCKDDVVKSSLVDFYAKCGLPDEAGKVFGSIVSKNVVSWTSLIYGYAMVGREGVVIELLRKMPCKNLRTWTAAISGFVQGRHTDESFRIFSEMRRDGVDIEDPFVLSSLIAGSSSLALLELGKQAHGLVLRLGYASNAYVTNALIDMYAKCSDLSSASKIFHDMRERDIISWTSIIVGMAQHGRGKEALSLYDDMVSTGLKPNEVTFTGLIYACSHVGLVEKGRAIFKSMVEEYGLRPSLQHYTCLLDLYSRSGDIDEAENVLKSMPFKPDETMWASLLSSCIRVGRTEIGVRIADDLLQTRPESPSTFVLMSNVYARAAMWDRVSTVRKSMMGLDRRKKPGYSWVDLGNDSRVFYAGETGNYPMKDEIFALLKELEAEMRKRGYVPDTTVVLHNMEQHDKEWQLFWHSERQAVAYALLGGGPPEKPVRVIKNLRICDDCHVVLKFICDIVRREIVVRDANRYHHFRDGKCSCSDFW
ncbi:pentatricopeptide repeat-containing protein At4g14050, mitochondrial [Andrographis paniculata]|uniref:pentatricopeptide repeat-containing protein At4g14050, mitochondrial n=1 Tax=Andrographis paniculata TaxID=175694 RepID=UPI0021E99524|nr:pentatricopeptide repeat-containing protein At4g14050, mitochondrial [Andrographis paniculata]